MNYSKISGQFVCKMAMLLAFMFAACSETNSGNGVAGGTVEETGVYALSGRVGDVYPKLLAKEGDSSANIQNDEGSLYAAKGTVVTIYELDSSSLAATGRTFVDTIDNDDGRFSFENLTLNSPYVLIETLDSCITKNCRERAGAWGFTTDFPTKFDSTGAMSVYGSQKYPVLRSAIVDLKKYKKISVNTLSNKKVPLVRAYFAEGKSFAEASKKAEQDILENIGIYEDLGSFEDLENEELNYVRALYLEISELDDLGREVGDEIKNELLGCNFIWIYKEVYFAPLSRFSASEEMQQYYLNTIKLFEYEVGYLAHKVGLGQCTELRENDVDTIAIREFYELPKFAVTCRSKKWVVDSKKASYTSGTMVDNRDGKTYKTVTYNWGDVTQTWMAENLNFADTVSSSVDSTLKKNLLGKTNCWEYDPSCEKLGRFYKWTAFMNIDESFVKLNADVYDRVLDKDMVLKTESVEDRCLAVEYDLRAYEDESNRIEYCHIRTEAGECYELDTARTLWDYCYHKYVNGIYFDSSSVIPESEFANYQGVCPDGWRIPNKTDWDLLIENMASQGVLLKDADASGFGDIEGKVVESYGSRVPRPNVITYGYYEFASVLDQDGSFVRVGKSEQTPLLAATSDKKVHFHFFNSDLFAVRCIKN